MDNETVKSNMRPEEEARRRQDITKSVNEGGSGQIIIDPKKKAWQESVVRELKERGR